MNNTETIIEERHSAGLKHKKIDRNRRVKECKIINFDNANAINRKNGNEVKVKLVNYSSVFAKLNEECVYPWVDELYASPKVNEVFKTCNSKKISIRQLFMKNTVSINQFSEDIYSLGLVLLQLTLLLSKYELEILKKEIENCKSTEERTELLADKFT